jgi:hypothetical protein
MKDISVGAVAPPFDPAQPSSAATEMEKAMGPDHSRKGIFVNHNCYRCKDGEKPCVQGGAHRCEYPHARDD